MIDSQRPLRILLVDDSPDDNFFHQRAIARSKVNAVTDVVNDGEEALSFLTSLEDPAHCPALIFLDINMPKMTGWEFLEHFATLPAEVRTSAVLLMLSTSPDPLDQERAEKNPLVAGFINKPLTAPVLIDVVRIYLNREG